MAPTYVGNSVDCGMTIGERATLDMATALVIAAPELKNTPDELADLSVKLAYAVLKKCWKEKA